MAKYIGLDLGTKSIGIATSQGYFANPYGTIRFESENFEQAIEKLNKELETLKPEKIIIGYPKNMDGSEGHRAEMVNEFVDLFLNKTTYNQEQVIKIDERLTTRMAKSIMIEADLSRKKQKQNKDGLAAQLILETYVNQLK